MRILAFLAPYDVSIVIGVHRFPLKSQVEFCNKTHLDALPGEIFPYTAMESRGFNMYGERISFDAAGRLLERLVAPREISLKVSCDLLSVQMCI